MIIIIIMIIIIVIIASPALPGSRASTSASPRTLAVTKREGCVRLCDGEIISNLIVTVI